MEQAWLTAFVTPSSKKDQINLISLDEHLVQMWTIAPPTKGKANKAIINFLAKTLGISSSRVSIAAGQTSRTKQVKIEGMTDTELVEWLSSLQTYEFE